MNIKFLKIAKLRKYFRRKTFVGWLRWLRFTFTRGEGKCKIMQINGDKGGEIGASALVPRPPRVLSIICDSKEKYETARSPR